MRFRARAVFSSRKCFRFGISGADKAIFHEDRLKKLAIITSVESLVISAAAAAVVKAFFGAFRTHYFTAFVAYACL